MKHRTYQQRIADIDPTINPVGVECAMRNQYSTLDHLWDDDFRQEIAIAHACEKEKPGFLKGCAKNHGHADEHAKWERDHSAGATPTGEVRLRDGDGNDYTIKSCADGSWVRVN